MLRQGLTQVCRAAAAAGAPSAAAGSSLRLLASVCSSTSRTISGLSSCHHGPQRLLPPCTSYLWQHQQQQGQGHAPCLSATPLLGAALFSQQLQQVRGVQTLPIPPAPNKSGGPRQLLLNALRKVPGLRWFLPAPPPKPLTAAEKQEERMKKEADFSLQALPQLLRPFPDKRPLPPGGLLKKAGWQAVWYNVAVRRIIQTQSKNMARMIPGYSKLALQVEVAQLYARVMRALACQNVDHYKDDVTEEELTRLRAQVRHMRQRDRFDRVSWELAEPIKAEEIKLVQATYMPIISHGFLQFVFKIPSRQRYAAYRKVPNRLGGSREVLVDGDPEAVTYHEDYWVLERKIFAETSMAGHLPLNSKWRLMKRIVPQHTTAAGGGGGGQGGSSKMTPLPHVRVRTTTPTQQQQQQRHDPAAAA